MFLFCQSSSDLPRSITVSAMLRVKLFILARFSNTIANEPTISESWVILLSVMKRLFPDAERSYFDKRMHSSITSFAISRFSYVNESITLSRLCVSSANSSFRQFIRSSGIFKSTSLRYASEMPTEQSPADSRSLMSLL